MSKLTRSLRDIRGRFICVRPEVQPPELPKHITGRQLRDDGDLRRRMTSQFGSDPVMKRMAQAIEEDKKLDEAKAVFEANRQAQEKLEQVTQELADVKKYVDEKKKEDEIRRDTEAVTFVQRDRIVGKIYPGKYSDGDTKK